MATVHLGPNYRGRALEHAREQETDVLVIGGGIVGAGAALDAAARGLSVTLVEARDLAAGTSSRSSKLIHGGLRYLEQHDFALVREALKERGLLLRKLAPHLVRPVRFLLPLQHQVVERAYIGAGVALYDTMGGARSLPGHRHLGRDAALRAAPGLRQDALVGAIQYYDAQVDDARHTMMVARTAAQYGASVLTRTKADSLLREGDRVTGVRLRDLESGEQFPVRARRVIGATGVWTDELYREADIEAPFSVTASKGVHLVVPADRIELDTGLILRTEKSVLFVIPWGEHWIVGTTDTPWELDKAHPAANAADVDYILNHVNAVLARPLDRADIEGVYAGLRPLVSGGSSETAQLSREHAVATPVPGLVMVAGGKYTTYRVMAADAVDAAVADFGAAMPASNTDRVPIIGAVGFDELWQRREQLSAQSGLSVARLTHLLRRYGSGIHELLALIGERPELGEPIAGATTYLQVEAVHAVTAEGALHLEDVLTRRTRISIEETDRGLAAAPNIAALIAPVLGWDAAQRRHEVETYTQRVRAEIAAAETPGDEDANTTRLTANEPVLSG